MNIKILRKLARTSKYQLLYNNAKELKNLRLFYNDIDLTAVQILFLFWLGVYGSLYTDLAMNKKYLSEEVIEDDLRAEAYLVWSKEENKKDYKDSESKKTPVNDTGIPSVVFVSKKKK